jgi:acyl-CoA synthetase (AMP-forming)/AMP-acid ligase II
MNLAHTLQSQVKARPGAAAIIDTRRGRPRVLTFEQLERDSCRAARLLTDLGLKPGDAVLVFYPMSAELYVALLALFRLGLVAMFLDPSAGREHIQRCCELHAPKALIASPKAHLLRLVSPALRRIPVKLIIGFPLPFTTRWARANTLRPLTEICDCADDTPALLTFTSGSTGQPKAAVRTHGFLMRQHHILCDELKLTAGDVDVATLPIVLLTNLGAGVTSLVPDADLRYPGKVAPGPVVEQMLRHHASSSVASPAFFERLTRYCGERQITLPGVKKLYTGGAPVFPRVLDQMHRTAPNAEVIALYGSTEAEPIAQISRDHISEADHRAMLAGRGLLAGKPVEMIALRILRDQWGKPAGPFTRAEFEARCCPASEPGEIVVAGEHVLKGYLNGQGDEETKFRVDGEVWHRTGDAGYLDSAGHLWLLGRCSAKIQDARGELYPFAAETAVYQDPNVKRAAMVSHQGRRVLAVEYYDPSKAGDIRATLAWTALDEVRVCASIPVDKRHNAKIDYPALARMLG